MSFSKTREDGKKGKVLTEAVSESRVVGGMKISRW
jgi:hypothetical protein